MTKDTILHDYFIAQLSRAASLAGRREVLGGRAKFGIFGDGKEVAQVAMARCFKKGDWRAGYYRDQTLMFALGLANTEQFFSQLYADSNPEHDPFSSGRQMNAHFSTATLDANGNWLNLMERFNCAADLSPTAGQMPKLLGLAYASKLYRELKIPKPFSEQFTHNGNEVVFGTIGDASTSEGLFWESMNAAAVLQVPLVMSIWDDGFGISVPKKYQTARQSISQALAGMQRDIQSNERNGLEIIRVPGWDYEKLLQTYQKASELARAEHVPVLVHVTELTQPQGHSTSGSHERYKDATRMEFERSFDCLSKMHAWIIAEKHATEKELQSLEVKAQEQVNKDKESAWQKLLDPIHAERNALLDLLSSVSTDETTQPHLSELIQKLKSVPVISRKLIASTARKTNYILGDLSKSSGILTFSQKYLTENKKRYSEHLLAEGKSSALNVLGADPMYSDTPELVDGSQVIRKCFDYHLGRDPRIFIVGEDVGHLGGVNTEFDGLQAKHGFWRVTDTGIREASILGQGIGAAQRGLRPIVDIQYLDYVLYCLQGMSDDLATLRYRTGGKQSAPVIIRTKGHRLEGIWHTGSPMGTILHAIRGIHFCVPRDMVQAAGFYNTLLMGDDPAFIVEVLNGYRLKEKLPSNLHEFRIPLGLPEILNEGEDITVVTYGACVRVVREALDILTHLGVSVELIDVRCLSPFDLTGVITQSLHKTNALLVVDEDVPGGASAYILQQILDRDDGLFLLDAPARCLSAAANRGPYASDGDYFTKPSAEDVVDAVLKVLAEREPARFEYEI